MYSNKTNVLKSINISTVKVNLIEIFFYHDYKNKYFDPFSNIELIQKLVLKNITLT